MANPSKSICTVANLSKPHRTVANLSKSNCNVTYSGKTSCTVAKVIKPYMHTAHGTCADTDINNPTLLGHKLRAHLFAPSIFCCLNRLSITSFFGVSVGLHRREKI